MSRQSVILLNGPSGVGKDTIGQFIIEAFGVLHARTMKFAAPMKESIPTLLGLERNWRDLEKVKNHEKFYGRTFREWQILLSEEFLKRFAGQEIFGQIFISNLAKVREPIIVVTDCGFAPEYEHVLQTHGAADTFLIRLTRRGIDFTGDSRGYVPNPNAIIDTSHSEMATKYAVAHIVQAFTGIEPYPKFHKVPKEAVDEYFAILSRASQGAVRHVRFTG